VKDKRTMESDCSQFSGIGLWKIIGSVPLALVAVGFITQLDDIRRYLRISTM
jgi:Family of unknown function (DUF6893)